MTTANRYPRFRAPAEDGQVFCYPSWDTLLSQLSSHSVPCRSDDVQLLGLPISDLAAEARESTIAAARSYTRQFLDAGHTETVQGPIIVTGHQPELFHPGVWYKNFTAARLAKACGGIAINLIIDSDLCRTASIRVPTGTIEVPRIENIAFDLISHHVPYEERQVEDLSMWNSFGERAADTISSLVKEPLVRSWWPEVVASSPSNNMGFALSRARHRLEANWGSSTLELPQSRLCDSHAFRVFALHLILHAESFRLAYNSALSEYRTAHRLRNSVQPVPDLHCEDGWIESPFWIWTSTDPTRRPLYISKNSRECRVTDRKNFADVLPLSSEADPETALEKLTEWESRGVKVRTRALTTTLYSRLLLADIFVHGIGGAKYDQVTDTLCRDFFGISLPPYATVSGTLFLPIKREAPEISLVNEIHHTLREIVYHPERHLDPDLFSPDDQAQILRLIDLKKRWVSVQKEPSNAALRHQNITDANKQLQPWLRDKKQLLEHELTVSQRLAKNSQIRNSREYSFCLFPSKFLQEFLLS